MNKKLILILLCLTSFGTAFAQTDFTPSARSKATAGQFESDSDYVNANDIYSIDRTFFSAGYQPSLVLGQNDSVGNMTGFWAMPINDTMTVGIAGEYKMESRREEISTFPSAGVIGGIDTSVTLNEMSAFNIRPVFKFGDFAVSYRIYRSGLYNSVETKTTMIPSGTAVLTNGAYNSGTQWEHEIGFAYQTDLFQLYVPIGAVINMDQNNSAGHNSVSAPTTITDTVNTLNNNTQANLYINPQITFPVEIGPITEFETGINFKVAVYNPAGGGESITTTSGDSVINGAIKENKTVVDYKDQSFVEIGTYIQTTMEWNTWEDKIGFIFEPTIGIDYMHTNAGKRTTTTTTTTAAGDVTETIVNPTTAAYINTVTPYLEADIGTVIKFVEWFEFRAGIHYGFNWENTTSTTSYELQDGGKVSRYDYDLKSQFEIYSGFGFIFGEDFFLDIYIAAGNFIDDDNSSFPTNPPTGDNIYNLFDIRNYGVQLSYRF